MGNLRNLLKIGLGENTFQQKFNYLKYEINKKKDVRLNYEPVTISIVATGRCNFYCDMCPTHSSVIPDDYPYIQQTKEDISFDTFNKVVDKFHKALNVQIIGSGEPLLNKDLFKMVEYATKEKKMSVKTFSNGAAVDANIDKIINSSLDGITISINGHNAKEFRRITGMEEVWYPKIYHGVKRLVKKRNEAGSKVKIKLSFIIDQQNYNHIPDMIRNAIELGVDHSFFCNFLPSPYDGFRAEERTLMASDEKIVNTIRKIWANIPKEVKKKVTLPTLLAMNRIEKGCNAHFSQIRVDGEGNVSSCSVMLLNMSDNGHFLDYDVWNNNFFQDMRRRFLENGNETLLYPCKVCIENYGLYPWK